ncbi:hypothetical protein C4577_06810 [Candidatus Parcubacteria bacterium]|nr:MAG: hypothetical protein C4577_06810 [Candidatus Parcubacteria bacterium]
MRYSRLFSKTIKEAPADEVSINAKLLMRGGFVDKLMAGSYSLLPLGRKVEQKIEEIIRQEMNKTGAQEVLMPLLHPKEIWNETGRWETAKDVMYQFKKNDKEYTLSFTHEEIMLDLVRKHAFSYKDYPVKIYHFSTKFRNELRAKSGLLRGREFLMKDLYSVHTTEQELNDYYWDVAKAYLEVFKKVDLEVRVVEAAGGVFTDTHTHEFQAFCETGEDIIYYCENCDFAENKEIAKVKEGEDCPKCKEGTIKVARSIEVGNIFRFGTAYSQKMNITYTDVKGEKQYPYLGSYGIGVTRLIGTIVELFHDDRGIIWPENVAPYKVHLIQIQSSKFKVQNYNSKVKSFAEDIYNKLIEAGVEVLYDDREDVSVGQKFADADLIGIPYRLVVSDKTGDKIEVKKRDSDKMELLSFEQLLKKIKS